MALLDFFSIRQKILMLLIFLISAVCYLAISPHLNTYQYNQISRQIEIAQQQKIITENFISHFFFVQQQAEINSLPPDNSHLNQIKTVFKTNVKAQLFGGKAYRDIKMQESMELSTIENETIRAEIENSDKLWVELQLVMQTLQLDKMTLEKLSITQHLADKLQQTLTSISTSLSLSLEQQTQQNLQVLKISWLIIVVIGSLFSWLIAKNITQPLNNVAQATSRIRLGDLQSYPDDNRHRDELGTLLYEADEMRLTLGKLISEIQQHNKQIIHSVAHLNGLFSEINTAYISQYNQHAYIEKQVNNLQENNQHNLHKITQYLSLDREKKQVIDGVKKSIEGAITGLNSSLNCHALSLENMTNLQKDTSQLFLLLSDLKKIVDKTEALAKKATIDAAGSIHHSDQFTLVANQITSQSKKTSESIPKISALLVRLSEQVNYLPTSIEQSIAQIEMQKVQLAASSHSLSSMKAQIVQQQNENNDMQELNKLQGLQIDALREVLDNALQLIKDNNNKTETNSLFLKDLYKISLQLDALSNNFKIDKIDKKFRKGNDNRRYPRINNQIEVSLQQEDHILHGLTEDISLSGLKMKSLQSLPLKKSVPVLFSLKIPKSSTQETESVVSMLANIIHYKQQGNTYYYSLRYHSTSPKEKEKIQQIFEYFNKTSEFRL